MAANVSTHDARSIERAVVLVSALIDIGGTGAPTINRARGVKSVSRENTGLYRITFGRGATTDKYVRCLGAKAVFVKATVPSAPFVSVKDLSTVDDGYIDIACFAAGGTATDPANGEKLLVEFTLSNSANL